MVTVSKLKLSFIEEQILKHFSRLIENEISEAKKIILFGSRAKGKSDESSDMDVAVVLDVSHVSEEMWERMWNIKWRVLESLDAEEFPFSLTLIGGKDLIFRNFGIEKVIREEGIVIWKREN